MINSRESLKWTPRWYYILQNNTTGKKYIGQTKRNVHQYLGSGVYWINHCKTHGGYTRENIALVDSWFIDDLELAEFFLQEFEDKEGPYWEVTNENWANLVREDTDDNPFFRNGGIIGKINNDKRLTDGTHNFLRGNRSNSMKETEFTKETSIYYNNKMLADGSHPLLSHNITDKMKEYRKSLKSGKLAKKQLKEGTHVSQNKEMCKKIGEINKLHNKKRVDDKSHQFIGGFYSVTKTGETIKITKEQYKSQVGNKSEWDYVHPTSSEGKRRRGIQ